MGKNKIIPQMFDVRPVDETGDLDWEKINNVANIPIKSAVQTQQPEEYTKRKPKAYQLGMAFESQQIPLWHEYGVERKNRRCTDDVLNDEYQIEIEKQSQQKYQQEILERKRIIEEEKEKLRIAQEAAVKAKLLEEKQIRELHEKEMQRQREMAENEREIRLARERAVAEQNLRLKAQKSLQIQEESRQQRLMHQERLQKMQEEALQRKIIAEKQRQEAIETIERIEKERAQAAEQARLRIEQERIEWMREQERQEEMLRIAEENEREEKRRKEEEIFLQQEKEREKQEAFLRAAKQRQENERIKQEQKNKQEEEKIKRLQIRLEKKFQKEDERRRKKQNALLLKKQKKEKLRLSEGWFDFNELLSAKNLSIGFNLRKTALGFATACIVIAFGIGSVSFAQKGSSIKGKVLGVSENAYGDLNSAIENISKQDFEKSSEDFASAYDNFSQAQAQLEDFGGILIEASKYIPFASRLSSGKNVTEAGKHIAAAGKSLNEVVKQISSIKNPIGGGTQEQSFLDIFVSAQENMNAAKTELSAAKENIDEINIDDLPEDKRDKFILLKEKLPQIISLFDDFSKNSSIIVDLLGGNGPRKYLFLFQNNAEMRATGGFIGSYGLLDISQGHVKRFYIDGIFNPDGQLKQKIIPPVAVQKISAAWSLHDSNWFADFPTSAKKAIDFFEKTGGPTTDGVITLTPTVMQKLLKITGPIDMPEYNVTLTADNFIEKTQYQVEEGYNKQENKPKKILSDLAPVLLEKLLSSKDMETLMKTAGVFADGLREKHILLYSENKDLQKIISQQGWSGEIIPAEKDYLSVVNTNINGYKTDAVIDESIEHQSEIQADGSIINTVTITRKHNGGNTDYEWWNKVNADYMRVYVPQGSQLLEVSGQTRETVKPPLDYQALGFTADETVQEEENATKIDENSGTRIYNQNGKTVFANWVYVSPQESATITYKYLLPFKLFQVSFVAQTQADSYSLIAQKQSGSIGSKFTSIVKYPKEFVVNWSLPDSIKDGEFKNETDLTVDRFEGIVFEKK